jgi:outer membrane protein TolC
VSAESEAARLAARAATLQFERARELTALHTLRAYTQVQLAEQGAVIAHEATDAARRHAQTTARLAREGRTVTADKLTAEVSLAAVESQQVQAQTRLEQARSQLKRVLGLAPDAELVVEPYPGAQVTVRPLPGAATPLENTALAARKDLQAVKLLAQAAAERVTAARALHKPKLDFVATHNRYDNTDAAASSSSVMGVVSLDLFAGGSHDAKIAEAAAEAKQAQWQERAAEQTVRAEVREAFEYYRDASRRHELAKGNVERARETVRQVETRYGQGRTILIDLLQAERGLSEARNEELQSRLSLETGAATLDTAQGKAVLAETTP